VDDRPAAGPQLTAAAGEDGKVICVLEVCAPGEVAMMYGGGQVGGGGVRDAQSEYIVLPNRASVIKR
jgi:hypothetical protein